MNWNHVTKMGAELRETIGDRIHAADGRLNVHCHGGVKSVIDCFQQYRAMVQTVTGETL